jgi:hypothetical protein
MGVEDEERTFDGFLLRNQMGEAVQWLIGELKKKPCNPKIGALTAFSFLLLGKNTLAVEIADKVLGISPYNDWALAVKFACSNNEEVNKIQGFFGFDGFRLGATWYMRFDALGFPGASKRLWGYIARFGPAEDRFWILRDVYEVERLRGY